MPIFSLASPHTQINLKKRRSMKDPGEENANIEVDAREARYAYIRHWLWYLGHLYIFLAATFSFFACLTRQMKKFWPLFIYRSTFAAVAVTYGISLWQSLEGSTPQFFALLPLDTFQHLGLGIMWLWTRPHFSKLVPYALISLLHSSEFANQYFAHGSKRSTKIFQGMSDHLAPIVLDACGYLDIFMILELVVDCLLVRPGAVFSLLTFIFFYQVRLMYNPITSNAFEHTFEFLDKQLARKDRPQRVRAIWIHLRNRVQTSRLHSSRMHLQETDNAIEKANAFHNL